MHYIVRNVVTFAYDRMKFGKQLDEVCNDAAIEPHLQPPEVEIVSSNATTAYEDARLDTKTKGLLGNNFKPFLMSKDLTQAQTS